MTIQYRIISAITNGTELSIIAKCCEQIGTRKDEHSNRIPILQCQNVTVVIIIRDLSPKNTIDYIKTEIEAVYEALPDKTLVKSLIGKTWSG